MKLTKQQINALATSFCKERNKGYEEERKRRDSQAREVWDKTPDGKLYAKLPQWMKTKLEGWALNEQVERVWKGKPLPKRIEVSDVEQRIILATIDATSMADITAALKAHFKN